MAHTSWQQNDHPPQPGYSPTRGVGGPEPTWHDEMDFLRSGWRATPEATYPNGYLGNVNSRREDRLLNGIRDRQRRRPAQRGVHKGENVDTRDYLWPEEFHPFSGIQAQAEGVKFVSPALEGYRRQLTNDGKVGPDPDRAGDLRHAAPPWSSVATGGPGMGMGVSGAY